MSNTLSVTVSGGTTADIAKQMRAIADSLDGVELKKGKKTAKAADETFDDSIDNGTGDVDDFNADADAGEPKEITDDELVKAFQTYAKETPKGKEKAMAYLKKNGFKTVKSIPQAKRAKVLDDLGV